MYHEKFSHHSELFLKLDSLLRIFSLHDKKIPPVNSPDPSNYQNASRHLKESNKKLSLTPAFIFSEASG